MTTTSGSSQQFAFRFERSRVATIEDTDCVMVLPDGRYRREQIQVHLDSFKTLGNTTTVSYVYEGQLGPEELKGLAEIVNRPEFRALREPPRLAMSYEFLHGAVLRDKEPRQIFKLSGDADYKPNKTALKPLFDWWHSLERRKSDLKKGAEANECRLPDRVALTAP